MNGKKDENQIWAEPWATYPDLLAAKASGGKWKPYRHLRYISNAIAPELIAGGGRFIITCPPRHGKSELISNWVPTWFLYNCPHKRVILASYAAEFAVKWGSKVKENLTDNRLIATALSKDTKAKKKFATLEGGQMMCAGVGGPITGEGADCVIKGTLIQTDQGVIEISELIKQIDTVRVASYDHNNGLCEYKKIEASKVKSVNKILEIKFDSGRSIRVTGNHPIYIQNKGYTKAKDLRKGDKSYALKAMSKLREDSEKSKKYPLSSVLFSSEKDGNSYCLQVLQKTIHKIKRRSRQIVTRATNTESGFLLLKKVSQSEYFVRSSKKMRSLLKENAFEVQTILLGLVPKIKSYAAQVKSKAMSKLQYSISTLIKRQSILFKKMCEYCSFNSNDWSWEFAFQTARTVSIHKRILRYETVNYKTGWLNLYSLLKSPKVFLYSSHQRKQERQSSEQSNYSLCNLPYKASQIETDTVSMVSEICGEEIEVYDIQVEKNHNFFANEILVHNCFIIDDPLKNWQDAQSELIRERHKDWYRSVVRTRLEPGASVVILQTRWHEDDLSGWLISSQSKQNAQEEDEHKVPWTVINMPALCDDPENDPLGRALNEPLCPERFDTDKLGEIESDLESLIWSALYQQRPTSLKGNIIQKEWLKFYDYLPESFDEEAIFADLTFKEGTTTDFTCIEAWGRKGADIYLLDQIRARMGFPDQIKSIRAMAQRRPNAHLKQIEEAANGAAVIEMLRHEIMGLVPVKPHTSKQARLAAVSPIYQAGNVYYPNTKMNSWVEVNLAEILSFPNAKHDDTVDVASMAVTHLARMNRSVSRLEALARW